MKKVTFLTLLLALSFGFLQAQFFCNASLSSTVGTNGQVDFTATGSGSAAAYYYSFNFGDGSVGVSSNGIISHTYTAAGVYSPCVTVYFTDSCSATACDSFYTSGSGASGCTASMSIPSGSNGVINFASTGYSGTGTPVYYSYSFGDGSSGGNANGVITHTYVNAGTYTPCVTIVFSDSCTATACDSFYTAGSNGGACQAAFTWFPDSSGQYSIIVLDQSTGNGLSYLWSFGDGSTSTSPTPSHIYNGPGSYVVCVTITSLNPACTSTFCDTIVVVNKMATAFSINVISSNVTAVDPRSASGVEVSLFPNPARDYMNVQVGIANDAAVTVSLMDLSGKLVAQQQAGTLGSGSHNLRIATQDLPAGMYMARVQVGETSSVRKVMIAH